ncbi:MAG: hypothetical protein ACPGWR_24385 [Ardenticatenaceae bacterium]
MFGKMFDMFDDIDTKKVVEVVNLVWDNRERFMDMVEKLPQLLRETGDSIESAGASAMNASAFLTGSGDNDSVSASAMSDLAANALERCYKEMLGVARTMDKLGQELDELRVPTLEPTYTEVMGINLVNGVEMGELQLLDNAAERLKGGSDRIEEIGKDLREVAIQMRKLGGALNDAGGDLNNVGVKLQQSGNTLRSLTKFGE